MKVLGSQEVKDNGEQLEIQTKIHPLLKHLVMAIVITS